MSHAITVADVLFVIGLLAFIGLCIVAYAIMAVNNGWDRRR